MSLELWGVERLGIGLLVLFLAGGCGPSSERNARSGDANLAPSSTARESVRLALNWFPEAEHGGYYAALVHGDYERAGLDVEIVPGGPGVPVIQMVASGQMDFGVSNADQILLGRAQQADVVAVMAPLQDSPRCIMVHQSSGIRTLEDLQDVTLAVTNTSTFTQYLRKKLPLKGVKIVPYNSGSVAQFLVQEDFAQQAYVFSEPFIARQNGGDPHAVMVSESGFNPYTSVLLTNRETLRTRPELVRRMVAASIRGWQRYLEAPEETNASIGRLNPEMGAEILAYGAEALVPLCINASVSREQLGTMTSERWKTLTEQLIESEAIRPGAVRFEEAFTTEFLDSERE